MTDICAFGELLIDFTPAGVSEAGMQLFERNPGGAPANVAVAGARLGLKTAFIGKTGCDGHGGFLRSELMKEGVDLRGLVSDPAVSTTLAFVELDASGERSFSFVRRGCGDTMLRADEVDTELIRSSRVLHLGTLSLTDEPSRGALYRAVETAEKAGVPVSCDLNWRAPLWKDSAAFVRESERLLRHVSLLKATDEEAALITGEKDYKKAADVLKNRFGIGTAAITLGEKGAYSDGVLYPAFPTAAVDTTGAGDCFWAAMLYDMLSGSGLGPRFACAAAALCVGRRGAIPSMPTLGEVMRFIDAC
ncbi:MAG: carbohydrate kinase [Oscillospiraceae bacterium]|jgi:fructokinase|nr:carbohydrate kinase [Oscillospiraceae bacterium]